MMFSSSVRRLALAAAASSFLCAAAPESPSVPFNPIRLNQLGFLPAGAKRAVVATSSEEPFEWRLVDADGKVRARGRTQAFGKDRASGEQVHIIDFTRFQRPGEGYRLSVGEMQSRPFAIGTGIYDRLQYDALAYFYHNRVGIPIEARLVGEQWARPAGHPQDRDVPCFEGTGTRGNSWRGCDYRLDLSGGWYDAGDHGKYVVNGGISLWTLLNYHERQQRKGGPSPFADGKAAIPERGNGVNDLLDEARWEMDFLLRMQVPEGKRAVVPVGVKRPAANMAMTEIDASGMAHHKMASVKWTSLPMAPDADPEKRVVYSPTTGATLNLAANAAQCARIWRDIDAGFSARCLAAAERAYAAATRNPEVYAAHDVTGSGGYGDGDFTDEFYWAAAELFITTGKPEYRQAVSGSTHFRASPAQHFAWPRVATLGTISLAVVPNGLSDDEIAMLRRSLVTAADFYLRDRRREGYAIPYSSDRYVWGSNSDLLNRAIVLALAHDFTGAARHRDGVIDLMDYLLGRNPLDQSYISGYGARPMRNPHHRFWAQQADPKFPPPPPGAISGGPNNAFGDDEIARELRGTCAPQTCWRDDYRTASMNEVAINWNAPLVWVAAWIDETAR
jgi:endoglucanase